MDDEDKFIRRKSIARAKTKLLNLKSDKKKFILKFKNATLASSDKNLKVCSEKTVSFISDEAKFTKMGM